MNSKRVIVVGGGITGLAAAWRLRQNFQNTPSQIHVQLLEASPRVGGALQSLQREGFLLETGPDCFITVKPRGLALCRELGLEKDLIGTNAHYRRSFILRSNALHPVPEGFYLLGPACLGPFLRTSLLDWKAKARTLLEPLCRTRVQTDESLGSFVRRRFGREMLDWMAEPMVAGIYGADPDRLSLRATFPQFLEMEEKFGSVLLGLQKRGASTRQASGARYSLFVTLRTGLQALADTLANQLGPQIVQTQSSVREIRRADGGWTVVKASGEVLRADALCLALPSYAAARLLRPLDEELAAHLDTIEYAPAATVNFAFREMDVRHPMDGFGFVVPRRENKLILGCTFAHRKFEGRAPRGFVLMRAFLGGIGKDLWENEDDETLTQKILDELRGPLQIQAKALWSQIQRHQRALPQYSVGHLPRIAQIQEKLIYWPGLALAGNWLHGVGIPDCIESGERAADSISESLRRLAPSFS